MILFPDAPNIDDTVGVPGISPVWQYDGEKWIGNFPVLPEPPSDGQPYLRGPAATPNWLLGTEYKLLIPNAGDTQIVYDVPDWARMVRVFGTCFSNGGTNQGFAFQASLDGTNYLVGTTDYMIGGVTNYTGTQATSQTAPVGYGAGYMCPTSDYNHIIPQVFEGVFMVKRPTSAFYFTYKGSGIGYYNSTVYYTAHWMMSTYLLLASTGSFLQVKKIRFLDYNSTLLGFGAGTHIVCEAVA